jgi:hypothetical protein
LLALLATALSTLTALAGVYHSLIARRLGYAAVIGVGLLAVAPGSVLSITGILANQFDINLGVPAISIALTVSLAIMVAPLLAIAVLLYSGAPAGGQTPGPSSATTQRVSKGVRCRLF